MKVIYAFYSANRYWKDRNELLEAYDDLTSSLGDVESYLLFDEANIELPCADCLVAVPMSGAVQRRILNDVANYKCAILYGGYISGNASYKTTDLMAKYNSAPTLMDCWAVLRRERKDVLLATTKDDLKEKLEILDAYSYVKGANVLKIGETEPWVVSNAKNKETYENKFGVNIIEVPQQELADRYYAAKDSDAQKYIDFFTANTDGVEEPTNEDLVNACKMAYALEEMMNFYNAKSCAIACFNLLKTGTTACLGSSYINDCTDMSVSCEGDVDSAVTMLFTKHLTSSKLWMANPGIHPDKTINFSHCTGPINCLNYRNKAILRNHHESSIGVSLQIEYPLNTTVTAVRISNECNDITIQKGITVKGERENVCRSQMYVKLDDFDKYINTALGCHQVFAFEDITRKCRLLAELFDLNIL